MVKKFFMDESGATAVEYGIMVALIACAIIIAVTGVGTTLSGLFGRVDTTLATGLAS
jgi:pilus assembly protein Flp/PilA